MSELKLTSVSEVAQLPTSDDTHFTFSAFVARERARLNAEMQDLQAKVKAVGRELQAIDAYEIVKAGRGVVTPIAGYPKTRRLKSASKRDDILAILKEDHGLTQRDIRNKLGLTSDASDTKAVS